MYYYLHGLVTFHLKDEIVIECSGVGYDVMVAHPDEFPIGENLFVFVCYFSHEDEQYFVGFKTLEEQQMFLNLTSVKGIGPKTALSALASTSVNRLNDAILNDDTAFLMRLPNIGKKSASQIVLDLKGKLLMPDLSSKTLSKNEDEAVSALKNLGFKENEIKEAISSISDKDLSTEEYITRALRTLNAKKGQA